MSPNTWRMTFSVVSVLCCAHVINLDLLCCQHQIIKWKKSSFWNLFITEAKSSIFILNRFFSPPLLLSVTEQQKHYNSQLILSNENLFLPFFVFFVWQIWKGKKKSISKCWWCYFVSALLCPALSAVLACIRAVIFPQAVVCLEEVWLKDIFFRIRVHKKGFFLSLLIALPYVFRDGSRYSANPDKYPPI